MEIQNSYNRTNTNDRNPVNVSIVKTPIGDIRKFLKPLDDFPTEALARISSAVEKSRPHEINETKKSGKDIHPMKLNLSTEKLSNGKFYEVPMLLDGFAVLNKAMMDDPEKVYSLNVSSHDLHYVLEDDLQLFTNLQILDASENNLPFARLGAFPSLKKLLLPCNQHLDLSYNSCHETAIILLATLPNLKYLDLTNNEIKKLPQLLRDMTTWRDTIVELILPLQIAALEESMSWKNGESILNYSKLYSKQSPLPQDVLKSTSRSFSDIFKPTSAKSSKSKTNLSQKLPIDTFQFSKIGYPSLQTLILERNKIESVGIFKVLSDLPNLKILNLNYNLLSNLDALVPSTNGFRISDVLDQDPQKIFKYEGLRKLEQLNLKHNMFRSLNDLIGLICLPALKTVYLAGNPIVDKCNLKGNVETHPFKIFPAIYNIQIRDIPAVCKTVFSMNNEHYSMATTSFGEAVVKKHSKKEISHHISKVIKKNSPVVHGNRNVAPHVILEMQTDPVYIDQKILKRSYSFTDEDVQVILKTGKMPSMKEIEWFFESKQISATSENLNSGYDFTQTENPNTEASDLKYDPVAKDSTFLTGVHITGGSDNKNKITEEKEENSDSDFDSFDMNYSLPLGIQASVRSLRHAFSNPKSYWRIMEESYLRPTESSMHKNIYPFDYSIKGPLGKDFDESLLLDKNYKHLEIRKQELDPQPVLLGQIPTPANSSPSPVAYILKDSFHDLDPNSGGIHYRKIGQRQNHSLEYSRDTHHIVNSKLLNKSGALDKGTIIYKKLAPLRKKINSKRTEALVIKNKDDFDEMKDIMASLDTKLLLIETDLASVLANSTLRKKIPHSQKILNEIQKEYSRIEKEYLTEAREIVTKKNEDANASEQYSGFDQM